MRLPALHPRRHHQPGRTPRALAAEREAERERRAEEERAEVARAWRGPWLKPWLAAHGLQPAVRDEELRRRRRLGDETDVGSAAETEALRVCMLLQDWHMTEPGSSSLASLEALLAGTGLGAEMIRMPQRISLPIAHEMAFARAVGRSAAAKRVMPTAAAYGDDFRWPASDLEPRRPEGPVALVLLSRRDEDVGWLQRLPPRVEYHVVQSVARLPSLPAENQTLLPDAVGEGGAGEGGSEGGLRGAGLLAALGWAAAGEEARVARTSGRRKHICLEPSAEADGSKEEERLKRALASKASELLAALRRDGGEETAEGATVSLDAMVKALRKLQVLLPRPKPGAAGAKAAAAAAAAAGDRFEARTFATLFRSWDLEGSGTIALAELAAALEKAASGRGGPDSRPLPPLVICCAGDPLQHNPRFLDEIEMLCTASSLGRALPRFTPLATGRGGERMVHCDLSGGPGSVPLLPIGRMWRECIGEEAPMPLWVGYTPAPCFAISREALMAPRGARGEEQPSAFYARALAVCAAPAPRPGPRAERGGVSGGAARGPEPLGWLASHAVCRLWKHIFVPERARGPWRKARAVE